MFKSKRGDKLLWNGLSLCIIISLFVMCFKQITVNAVSTTCNTSSDCSLREWLVTLKDEAFVLECTLKKLEKSTALLNCNIPVCDSKCLNCTSGICSNCTGNWNGTTCSTCKTGWNGTDCNTPICGSNCASCASPNVCPTCKSGWYGSDCGSNTILTSAQITKFTSLILPNAQLTSSKLLFKASRDGFSASTFHSKCDGKGPTIVIIKATTGAIFGGYTSAPWKSLGGTWEIDVNAFLFSLISSTGSERFTRLYYQASWYYKTGFGFNTYAVYMNTSNGPSFGGGQDGHDIYISDNSNTNSLSHSKLCYSYCDDTMTLNDNASQTYLAGSYNFQVEDYEVYLL